MGKYTGQPWSPSNGTEGMCFTESFCERCIHEKFMHTHNENDRKCPIFTESILKWPEGPKEWQYDENDHPTCTNHTPWDWGNDGDPDDPDNPNYTPPPDPNQLNLFPLYPTEKDYSQAHEKQLVNQ